MITTPEKSLVADLVKKAKRAGSPLGIPIDLLQVAKILEIDVTTNYGSSLTSGLRSFTSNFDNRSRSLYIQSHGDPLENREDLAYALALAVLQPQTTTFLFCKPDREGKAPKDAEKPQADVEALAAEFLCPSELFGQEFEKMNPEEFKKSKPGIHVLAEIFQVPVKITNKRYKDRTRFGTFLLARDAACRLTGRKDVTLSAEEIQALMEAVPALEEFHNAAMV